jgi:hypothetical protein
MSNDPNRLVEQQRHKEANRSHNTMETYKLEKGQAPLPAWQQNILYVLAGVGVIAIIVGALAVLGVL